MRLLIFANDGRGGAKKRKRVTAPRRNRQTAPGSRPLRAPAVWCENEGKPANCLEYSTVSSERQKTTDISRGYIISERFVRLRTLPGSGQVSACRINPSNMRLLLLRNVLWDYSLLLIDLGGRFSLPHGCRTGGREVIELKGG